LFGDLFEIYESDFLSQGKIVSFFFEKKINKISIVNLIFFWGEANNSEHHTVITKKKKKFDSMADLINNILIPRLFFF